MPSMALKTVPFYADPFSPPEPHRSERTIIDRRERRFAFQVLIALAAVAVLAEFSGFVFAGRAFHRILTAVSLICLYCMDSNGTCKGEKSGIDKIIFVGTLKV